MDMDKKTKNRPTRATSYQGSYLEMPIVDNDDLYSGHIYRLNTKISTEQEIAREIGNKDRQSATQTKERAVSCSSCPESEKISYNNSHIMSPDDNINFELINGDTMTPTTSKINTVEVRNNKRKLQVINGNENHLNKKMKTMNDIDSVMMPPPSLPLRSRKCKVNIDKIFQPIEQSLSLDRDWHEQLKEMYGSVENAEQQPWMTNEEKDMLSKLPKDHKKLDKFNTQNWDFKIENSSNNNPLFKFPSEEGLSSEICCQLQFVRDTINLYRTLALPNSSKTISKRPIFLPFLRRNLRYNNYIPENTSIKNDEKIFDKKSDDLFKIINNNNNNNNDSLDSSDNTTESEYNDQDIGIKLISIKHRLLPAGHNASVTFFYTRYSYKKKSFHPIHKIDSSTFIVEVKDNIPPVNIDLPPELDYDNDDPSDLFIVLRVVFFDAAKDVTAGRSLRNVPARLAGQCERAREAESKNGKPMRRMRETREGDQAMFGAFQLTKKTSDGLSYACGGTSLILVETEKLEIDPNTSTWQKDGSIVFRMIALGRKYHSNPFALMEVITSDDDDSVISMESKKIKKYKRKSNESINGLNSLPDEINLDQEKEFDYSFPPLMIYQLSFDFIFDDNEEKIPITTGFNAIVIDDEEKTPDNIKRVYNERKTLIGNNKEFTNVHKEMINTINEKHPSPKIYSYKVTRSSGWCIFCEIKCKNLFALMWHLKTCHSRFEYVYKNVIEYKPGQYLPGIVMKKAPIDEDMYWNRRKLGIFAKYNTDWPHKYSLDGQFITPCNYLFKKTVDTFQDVAPTMSLKEEFNKLGPRPLEYKHTVHGRLVKQLPNWMAEKMEHDLKDIVDLDNLEIVFMLLWNNFLFEYGPAAGKETNVYRLCRLFIENRRKEIQENHLEIVTLILVSYFVEQNILSAEELYDLIMRLNRNYNPFTDILHPLSVSEKIRAQIHIKREAIKAEKLKRKRPKKIYEKSSISLRRRDFPSTDTSRSTSNEPIIDDEDSRDTEIIDSSSQDYPEKSISTTPTQLDTADD